jgi:SAM-dependent methyltransferase
MTTTSSTGARETATDAGWHNRLIRRMLRDAIARRAPRYLHGRLIDIGCGAKPYERLLEPFVAEHVGVDHEETVHGLARVDLVGTVYAIPAGSGSFDSALCTEVLEHVEEPLAALRECHRVLRPGGHLLLTCPFMWQLHEEPRDFFRYSREGLRYLLGAAGFTVVQIKPLGGFWTTWGQFLSYVLLSYDRGVIRSTRLLPIAGIAVQKVAARMERWSPRPAWTSHFVAVARKPAGRDGDRVERPGGSR